MALIVETGLGVATANSYATVATADAYHLGINPAWASGAPAAKEAALIRATRALDATYDFAGLRSFPRSQALLWPRADTYDTDDYPYPANELPRPLVNASCEAALRELVSPGALMPDLVAGGAIVRKEVKAGPVSTSTEYAPGSIQRTAFPIITGILSAGGLISNSNNAIITRA